MSRRGRPPKYASVMDRVLTNVKEEPAPAWAGVEGPCWIWQRAKNSRGYGRMQYWCKVTKKVKHRLVHRLVTQLWYGVAWENIPVSAHLCGNKACCSPLHLDVQTPEQNRLYYYNVEKPLREGAVVERIPF